MVVTLVPVPVETTGQPWESPPTHPGVLEPVVVAVTPRPDVVPGPESYYLSPTPPWVWKARQQYPEGSSSTGLDAQSGTTTGPSPRATSTGARRVQEMTLPRPSTAPCARSHAPPSEKRNRWSRVGSGRHTGASPSRAGSPVPLGQDSRPGNLPTVKTCTTRITLRVSGIFLQMTLHLLN